MRLLTLTEYQTTFGVPLTTQERDALRRIVGVAPAVSSEGCYDLTPGSLVGAVALPDLAVEIRPKLPIDRLLFLISYTLERRRWELVDFDLQQAESLVEAIVPGFVRQVRRALQRGVLQGYRIEEAALQTVRGRVRFDDQLRERFGVFPPAEVRYDEYTEDIMENRLLKAAIARLGRLRLRSTEVRRSLRAFDLTLAGVQAEEYDARHLPEIIWTRLNERYRPAVDLARLILRATSFDVAHGGVRATGFLVDMNKVFEDFVALALRDELRLSERVFPQGSRGHTLRLDLEGRITLLPDISWWDAGRPIFVGDVKYKRLREDEVKNADIYQVLAYTIAADLPGGLLIYASGEREPAVHTIVHLGKRIEIVTLDLRGPPDEVLAQARGVAQRVRRMRAEGFSRLTPALPRLGEERSA
jgi:5-methylcytosine-specific restriction enzyme subunit McrC